MDTSASEDSGACVVEGNAVCCPRVFRLEMVSVRKRLQSEASVILNNDAFSRDILQ